MSTNSKTTIDNFIAALKEHSADATSIPLLQKNSVGLFTAMKASIDDTEEVFRNENTTKSLYDIIIHSNINENELWISFIFELVKCAYSSKNRPAMQRFIKSLIPLLLSYYTIKYYQEFYPAKVKVSSSEANPLEANVFGGLLIEIYNMELENAKKLNQSPGLNTFKELTSFHEKYQRTLLESSESQKQGEDTQLSQPSYEAITSINPQQHLILCEVLIRIFCADINYYFSFVFPHFISLVYILMGVSLDSAEVRNETSVPLFKIQQVQTFLVRITAPAMQDMIFAVYQILICQKHLKREVNFCLDLMLSKMSNESQFKLADMCQSVIDLTRDEYDEIYSL